MDHTLRLLIAGDFCPDIVVSGVPTAGTSLRFGQAEDVVAATTITLGGSGSLTAAAAAAYGAGVRLLAVIGDDEFGRLCLGWLDERGVDTSPVIIDRSGPTGSSVILVRRDDPTDRQILSNLGVIPNLTIEQLTDELLAAAGHLHVNSFFLQHRCREQLAGAMHRARALGLTVSLDTNDDPERQWAGGAQAAIAAADILFCNDNEALGLAGLPSGADPAAAVRALLATMPDGPDPRFPAVVHKLGADGAAVWTRTARVYVPAPPMAVVDTIGAGDALAGTALAALLTDADWPAALRAGVAAGSLSTTAVGGATARPGRDLVEATARDLSTHRAPQEGTP